MTPDVIVDMSSIILTESSINEVVVTGVKGKIKPEKLKVSISYFDSYMTEGSIVYSWPEAYVKSKEAEKIIRKRMKNLDINPKRICVEHVGVDACHGRHGEAVADVVPEVKLRIAVADCDKKTVKDFSRLMAPLVLNGPPSATGYASGKGAVRELFGFWPSLIDRSHIKQSFSFIN